MRTKSERAREAHTSDGRIHIYTCVFDCLSNMGKVCNEGEKRAFLFRVFLREELCTRMCDVLSVLIGVVAFCDLLREECCWMEFRCGIPVQLYLFHDFFCILKGSTGIQSYLDSFVVVYCNDPDFWRKRNETISFSSSKPAAINLIFQKSY